MASSIAGLGLWAIVSTLALAGQGQAHTFSRHYVTFSATAAPEAFVLSYWLHLAVGLFLLLLGILHMVRFVKRRD